eukprot:m.76171 g.76171  ORF g.76171 m.76171 type:complete len:580 (+) comp12545_c0_seq8:279-2018(+)
MSTVESEGDIKPWLQRWQAAQFLIENAVANEKYGSAADGLRCQLQELDYQLQSRPGVPLDRLTREKTRQYLECGEKARNSQPGQNGNQQTRIHEWKSSLVASTFINENPLLKKLSMDLKNSRANTNSKRKRTEDPPAQRPKIQERSFVRPNTSSFRENQTYNPPPPRKIEANTSSFRENQSFNPPIAKAEQPSGGAGFVSARYQLEVDDAKKGRQNNFSSRGRGGYQPPARGGGRSIGLSRPTRKPGGYIPPNRRGDSHEERENPEDSSRCLGEKSLHNVDEKLVELIQNEIIDHNPNVTWDDVAGLDFAKKTINEIVVFPMIRPDLFTGLRASSKGVLLFGPPGTGKTLLAKCIASSCKSTFFSISASSLTSKWVGEGEKLVRALFAIARTKLPAVIFIDEIDSLLSRRSDDENEGSRRIKTEFLVQLDGATTTAEENLLVIGATNRPQEIDEAARRRLTKRLYIPLPDKTGRTQLITRLLKGPSHVLSEKDIEFVVNETDGYSGSDLSQLCKDAAMAPLRNMLESGQTLESLKGDEIEPIRREHFSSALRRVRPSVHVSELTAYEEWNKQFGSAESF